MNKNFKDITKKFFHPKRGLKDPQIMHPEREWLIGLALMATIFFCIALWSVGVYIVNKDAMVDESAPGSQSVTVYRESMVKDALKKFAKREDELNQLLSKSPARPQVTEEISTTTSEEMLSGGEENQLDLATSTVE